MKIETYLINLDGSDERLVSASAQLQAQGVPFTRVPAVDGRKFDLDALPYYDKERAVRYMGRPLRGGEIGCYLSHLDCAQRFLDSGADYGVVLEDDMQLSPRAWEQVMATLTWLHHSPEDWDVLHIAADRHKYVTPLERFGAHTLVRAHYFPMTTTAIIWRRQGAERLLAEHQTIWAPIDNLLREWQSTTNKGLSIDPPLVSTTGAESDIDGGHAKRNHEDRSFLYGLRKQRRMLRNKARALRHKVLG